MPYIPEERRKNLTKEIRKAVKYGNGLNVIGELAETPGELNYIITEIVLGYLQLGVDAVEPIGNLPLNYTHLNEVVGALECAKFEAYRRLAAPYEDTKRNENGEVYFTGLEEHHRNNELCSNCGGYAGGSDGVCLSCAIIGKEAC